MTSLIEYCIVLSSGDKNDVDEALVDMVIEDSQPFTIVEDKGFRKLVKAYALRTRQACM